MPGLDGEDCGGMPLLKDGDDIDGGEVRPGEFRTDLEREYTPGLGLYCKSPRLH